MSKDCGCVYFDNGKCQKYSDDGFNSWCMERGCKDKTPSRADRVRNKSDEEFAAWLAGFVMACVKGAGIEDAKLDETFVSDLAEWLKEPAEGE